MRNGGALRRTWLVWGGRAPVRAVLYMGALFATRRNPFLRVFYRRLVEAGEAKKVALIAGMRKLVTILNAASPSETPTSIQAGTYALRITSGAMFPTIGQAVVCMSVGVPDESLPTSLSILVSVEASGTQIVGRDANDTLVLSLRQSVNDVSGTIRGFALAQDGRSTLTAGDDAHLAGRVTSATSLSGDTDGGVTVSQGNASYSCSRNRWTLSRQ